MNYLSIIGLFNFIAASSLAVFVFFKNRHNPVNKAYLYLTLSVAFFNFGYFMWNLINSPAGSLFWYKFAVTGVIFINVTFIHFVFAFLGILKKKKKVLYILYAVNFLFVYLNAFSYMYKQLVYKIHHIVWAQPLPLFHVYLIFWFLQCFYGFYYLVKGYKNTAGLKKLQVKYFMIGALIGFSGGATNWPMWYNVPFPPYLNILITVYIAVIAYAIVKYRLMDIRVALARAGIFAFVYIFVLGIPLFLGHKFGFWPFSTYLAIILATIGPFIYNHLRAKAEDIILAQQRRYQKILLQAAGGMVRQHDLDKLLKLIVYIIKRSVKVKFTAIFLKDEQSKSYTLRESRDHHKIPFKISFSLNHPLITYIYKVKSPFLYEESPAEIKKSLKFNYFPALIVPSFTQDELLGFLVLGEKENNQPFSNDDLNIFRILSHQAALAIENCIFLKEFQKTQNRIFEAEKLASIGGMAEGVAHQIKNRLNLFSVASGEIKAEIEDFAKKHSDIIVQNPSLKESLDYISHTSETLIDNVKRTNNVIKSILDYARAQAGEIRLEEFSLRELINFSVELLKIKHQVNQIPLKIDLNSVDSLYGIRSQIIEVIYNLLDNAYEATQDLASYYRLNKKESSYAPQINFTASKTGHSYLLVFSDNGIGIQNKDKAKIFAPFFTTKSSYKSGSGIGMYIVKRLIEENHQGKIWFDSTYLKGTTFYIRLPQERPKS